MLAIEIYNKPTIRSRIEGFTHFLVNAWELMLKAYLVSTEGEESIYYKDHPNRTISLSNCIKKIFTNDKDPLRKNLEKIIELRNISTHFITEEYDLVYIPLFQANIINFTSKLNEFLGVDILDYIPENFLSLPVTLKSLSEQEIRGKYSEPIATKLIETAEKISSSYVDCTPQYAIRIEYTHYLTKKKGEATETFNLSKNAKDAVYILKQNQNPNLTHPLRAKILIEKLNKRLYKEDVKLLFHSNITSINKFHLTNLIKFYQIKEKEDLCFKNTVLKPPQYSYSQKAVDFLFDILSKNPDKILDTVASKQNK